MDKIDIEIQTAETSETIEKRDTDRQEFCAKLNEYKDKRKHATNKRKYDKLLITPKEKEIKNFKGSLQREGGLVLTK